MAHNVFLGTRIAGSRSHALLLLAFFSLFLCEIITSAAEDPISLEQLIAELAHPDPNRRWDAVAALGAHRHQLQVAYSQIFASFRFVPVILSAFRALSPGNANFADCHNPLLDGVFGVTG